MVYYYILQLNIMFLHLQLEYIYLDVMDQFNRM